MAKYLIKVKPDGTVEVQPRFQRGKGSPRLTQLFTGSRANVAETMEKAAEWVAGRRKN